MFDELQNIPDIDRLKLLVEKFKQEGRYDLLLNAIGVPALQQLNVIAAKSTLSPLVITEDYRFLLPKFAKEVETSPVHKALYLVFLNHPEGIEFKRLVEHRDELDSYYRMMSNRVSEDKINDTIDRLVNPLDNAIHEKCARIKAAFASCVNQYQLEYYSISGHTQRHVDGSSLVWFERKKTITLPRDLVEIKFHATKIP